MAATDGGCSHRVGGSWGSSTTVVVVRSGRGGNGGGGGGSGGRGGGGSGGSATTASAAELALAAARRARTRPSGAGAASAAAAAAATRGSARRGRGGSGGGGGRGGERASAATVSGSMAAVLGSERKGGTAAGTAPPLHGGEKTVPPPPPTALPPSYTPHPWVRYGRGNSARMGQEGQGASTSLRLRGSPPYGRTGPMGVPAALEPHQRRWGEWDARAAGGATRRKISKARPWGRGRQKGDGLVADLISPPSAKSRTAEGEQVHVCGGSRGAAEAVSASAQQFVTSNGGEERDGVAHVQSQGGGRTRPRLRGASSRKWAAPVVERMQ